MWPTQLPAEYLVTPPNLRVGAPGSSTSAPAQRQQLSCPNAHVLPQWASAVAGSRSRYRRPRPVAARQTSLLTSHPRHQDGQKTHRARSWPCAPSPRPGPSCSRPAWSRRHRFPRRHKAGTATAHTPVVAAPPSPAGSHPLLCRHPTRRRHRCCHGSPRGARTCRPWAAGPEAPQTGWSRSRRTGPGILGAFLQLRHVRLAVHGEPSRSTARSTT